MLTTLDTPSVLYGILDPEREFTRPRPSQKKPKVTCDCTDRHGGQKKAYPNLEEARSSAMRRDYGVFRTYKCPQIHGYFHLTGAEWPPTREGDSRTQLQEARRAHRRARRTANTQEARA
ncbi:hypothetical protein [Agromyces humi]|uniref:hypothetical protein n=1 Tax=Agromyces humi TaxID=1766800 RepID=UPI0013568DFA|nr:hypothetical protein [Agromyces humi]